LNALSRSMRTKRMTADAPRPWPEMMDSRIETANCEHLADRRHAKRRIARHGKHVCYLAESSRVSFHRGWRWRTGRTGSPRDFSSLQQPEHCSPLPRTPSSIKPVRPVRHHPILWISWAFWANRSGRSSVRLGYAKGQFGSPLAGSGLLGAPRCCPANRPACGTRSVLVRLHRYPLALLLPEQAVKTLAVLSAPHSCRHNMRYRESPHYL
jgi:hypothetical protein